LSTSLSHEVAGSHTPFREQVWLRSTRSRVHSLVSSSLHKRVLAVASEAILALNAQTCTATSVGPLRGTTEAVRALTTRGTSEAVRVYKPAQKQGTHVPVRAETGGVACGRAWHVYKQGEQREAVWHPRRTPSSPRLDLHRGTCDHAVHESRRCGTVLAKWRCTSGLSS
jgi:hypothetical protein